MHEVSKEQIFGFMYFYRQKTNMADMVKFGYGCMNGFIARKQFILAEGNIKRKSR